MEEILPPSDSANSTSLAMKSCLGNIVVKKSTNGAEVLSKSDAADYAALAYFLASVALGTLNVRHSMSVHLVSGFRVPDIFLLIVAVSTPEQLVTTR
mmetsp:Transcript_27868/g.66040  ORF Transcript_27868/g.66040 Transcript_27868/m.66040 type:complete len:97 (+) Transcript_27868:413-703(+)